MILELKRRIEREAFPGYRGKADAPTPVDMMAVARAQGKQNRETALWNTQLQRPNQTGPTGTTTWTQDKTDPTKFTQTTALAPDLQSLFDLANKGNLTLQGSALGNIKDPFSTSGLPNQANANALINSPDAFLADKQKVSDAIYNQMTRWNDPRFNSAEESLRTRLTNQGLDENSQAYKQQLDEFNRNKTDAYQSAENQAVIGGTQAQTADIQNLVSSLTNQQNLYNTQFGNAITLRDLPLNEYSAFKNGSALPAAYTASQLNGGAAQSQSPDLMNAAQQNYQQSLDATNVQNANTSGAIGAGVGAVGAAAAGYTALVAAGVIA